MCAADFPSSDPYTTSRTRRNIGKSSLYAAFLCKMNKLEYLNTFLTERLMTVAGEIFEVFKDTVSEYQGEIERIRHENRRLRNTLAEIDVNSVQQTPGPKTSSVEEVKKHSSSQRPLDSEPSLIQVKLELATLNKQYEQQQSQSHPYTCTPSDFSHATEAAFPDRPIALEENESEETYQSPDSGLSAIKVEPCGSQTSFSDNSRPVENNEEGSDPFSCSYCDETFNEMSDLAAHLQGHMALFSCEVCGKSFKKKASLKTHKIVHQKEKPYRCKLCGKSYSCTKVLNVHLISHTGERPFGCSYCEKRFKLKSHLKEHERIHTGEKPFSCPVCRKSFTRSNPVKIHLRNHHRELYS